MDYLSSCAKSITNTRVFQWSINKVRSSVYPWMYNKWEANLIRTSAVPNARNVSYTGQSRIPVKEKGKLWLGSLESACDRDALKKYRIKHIVTAVYDIDPIFPDDPELMYLKVPVIDEPNENIAKHFNRAIDFIDEAINKGENVLVHCVYGVSRSSTLICAYLAKKAKMSVTDSINLVKQARPKANPNIGFLNQLYELEYNMSYTYGVEISLTESDMISTRESIAI